MNAASRSWVRALIAPTVSRVRTMIGRGVLKLIDEGHRVAEVQLTGLAGRVHDGVERFGHYGFASSEFPEAECVYLMVGGAPDHVVVIATEDRRYRLQSLSSGEVALYDDQGQTLILKRGGEIELSPGSKVTIQGDLEVNGDVVVSGDVTDQKTSMETIRQTYNGHTHVENQPSSNVTNPPVPQFP